MRKKSRRAFIRELSGRLVRAAYPKPSACENCGKVTKFLHAHHVGRTWAELYHAGLALKPEAHHVHYICIPCHKEAHKNDPWVHLIGRKPRGRTKKTKKAR